MQQKDQHEMFYDQHFRILDVSNSTFVLTESGFETLNLKYCGRYLRSASPSLYRAVQTKLKIVKQRQIIRLEYNQISKTLLKLYIWHSIYTTYVCAPSSLTSCSTMKSQRPPALIVSTGVLVVSKSSILCFSVCISACGQISRFNACLNLQFVEIN